MTRRETGAAEVFDDFPWEPDAGERDRDRAPLLPAATYFRQFPWRPEEASEGGAGDARQSGEAALAAG